MIRSFSDAATEDLYHGRHTSRVRRFPPTIISAPLRKQDVLAADHELVDLRMPPGSFRGLIILFIVVIRPFEKFIILYWIFHP